MVGEIFERTVVDAPAPRSGSLKARIVSGIVLAAAALACNAMGGLWFVGLVSFVVVAMAWEWAQITRGPSGFDAALIISAAAVVLSAAATHMNAFALALGLLCLGAVSILAFVPPGRRVFSVAGIFYIGLPTVALIWFRADGALGVYAVLFIFVVVWCTDTFAFGSGKLIGGPRLWPSLSGQKTWAGLLGGVFMAGVAAGLFAHFVPGADPISLACLGTALGLLSQAGDLLESAIKRYFGVKHASNLIPGHGGVMDRMDGIVGAVAGAALFALVMEPGAPARALLLLQ
ncbi:MAG: hypothetical protein RLZ98_338 [Pseudomonadota bacterium]|jgi:phosphatidate cytidylyltransferase